VEENKNNNDIIIALRAIQDTFITSCLKYQHGDEHSNEYPKERIWCVLADTITTGIMDFHCSQVLEKIASRNCMSHKKIELQDGYSQDICEMLAEVEVHDTIL
jgi:hypothetical protein